MPISEYFDGSGARIMESLKKVYGPKAKSNKKAKKLKRTARDQAEAIR